MRTKAIGFLVALMLGSAVAWAASYTTNLNIPLTNDSSVNSALKTLDSVAGTRKLVSGAIFCGQLVSSDTIYGGPCSPDGGDAVCTIGGTACDALDSTTEATADAPIYTNLPVSVYGMRCKVSSSGSNGVPITLRSGAADTSPVLTCTVPTGSVDCQDTVPVTRPIIIGAGATMAIKSVTTEDLSLQDVRCVVFYSTLDKNN